MIHAYLGVENLTLTPAQKQTLVDGLKTLGVPGRKRPCEINHWRVRLDGEALIFEALWQVDTISIAALKTRLANIFGVPVANISHTTASTAYGPLVTFKYGATNRLRLIQFGGVTPTWDQSHTAALAYLADNLAAWEPAA